ncbi:MAG: exodeoxyribonuclease VII large subunit [Legionellaceae bacterium]|nr:exodeoxyribonuclease VII large subunit [Legionellaceae bacterium]
MQALSVSQLNRQIKTLLEQDVGEVFVGGEVSNLAKPASGHLYFTMKDATAQIKCVFFRNRHLPAHKQLANGQQVCARGKLSLYEARGDYQLIVEQLTEDGLGDLHKLFELLKAKLQALGLFDAARKKPLPKYPNCIGIITSKSGAAIRDILATLQRRFPCANILVYASDVQGKGSELQLKNAIIKANADMRADVLILARGGGSLEDLWAFNDEKLAHTIAQSTIPIVSGVGHEVDFTIADFVADMRAATPTAAAEAVTPNILEISAYINILTDNMLSAMRGYLSTQALLLKHQLEKLSSPGQLIASHWQKVDYLELNLQNSIDKGLLVKQHNLQLLTARLHAQNPRLLLSQAKSHITQLEEKMSRLISEKMQTSEQRFKTLLSTLNAVSPLATLDRGYAIVMYDDRPVFNSNDVDVGDRVAIKLAKGHLTCEVLKDENN